MASKIKITRQKEGMLEKEGPETRCSSFPMSSLGT